MNWFAFIQDWLANDLDIVFPKDFQRFSQYARIVWQGLESIYFSVGD